MKYGKPEQKSQRKPQYETWGIAGDLSTKEASQEQVFAAKSLMEAYVDLSGLTLTQSKLASHYRGEDLPPREILFLRFEANNPNEHTSFCIDINDNKLIGLSIMKPSPQSETIAHTEALRKAINFLTKVAPEFELDNVELPQLIELTPDQRVTFDPPIKIGNVELHWISDHAESPNIIGKKVKTYDPKTKLWTWVIIDSNGNIQTYEHGISWNFIEYQRNSQMWLHSKWLTVRGIL